MSNSLFKLTPSDCLIDWSEHQALIMKWFDDKLIELKMIYRASEDLFTRKSFDEHCLNKGPTLTVIQSDKGNIFGGYISQSW